MGLYEILWLKYVLFTLIWVSCACVHMDNHYKPHTALNVSIVFWPLGVPLIYFLFFYWG